MDDNSYIIQIIVLIGLVCLSAFFSSSETSLTLLNSIKRKKLAAEKKKNVKFLEKLYEKPGRMLTTILLGNTMINILASITATFLFVDMLGRLGIHNEALITTITMVFMTLVLLILGELVPKTIALKLPEAVGLFFSRPIYWFSYVLYPVIEVLYVLTKFITRITGGKALEKGSLLSEEEIKIFINMGLQEGILEEEEEKMLTSIIEFGDIVVREIMTPRTAIISVDINTTPRKMINLIKQHWHSRIPVYADGKDNIIGFVYAKDLLLVNSNDRDNVEYIRTILREPFLVPESKRIDDLLREMRKKKVHVAMVVDEYGGISGLVTIEDIIEEIVGDIHDEYDDSKEDLMFEKIGEDIYLVNGLANVGDLNEELDIAIPEADNYDSIAGFVVDKLGKLPQKGDVYEDKKIKIIVLNVMKRRITKLKLEILTKGEEPAHD
ncbi:MAG: hemolysin family protein [Candidatus Margulisbacteria bacterium]|nr:hemolysin family protein [Candidatus Margulisiibacteriota bacterium]